MGDKAAGEAVPHTGLWRSILDDTLAKEARAKTAKNLLILGMRAVGSPMVLYAVLALIGPIVYLRRIRHGEGLAHREAAWQRSCACWCAVRHFRLQCEARDQLIARPTRLNTYPSACFAEETKGLVLDYRHIDVPVGEDADGTWCCRISVCTAADGVDASPHVFFCPT